MARVLVLCVVALGWARAWGAVEPKALTELELYVAPSAARIPAAGVAEDASEAASLVAARGERESFFVVLRGAPAGEKIEARATALRGKAGALPQGAVKVSRAAFVEQGGALHADALLPLEVVVRPPFREAENLPLFVELSVPRSARPGVYTGALQVSVGHSLSAVPIRLEVLNAALPARASLPAAFDYSEKEALFGAPAGTEPQALTRALAGGALASRVTLLGLGGVPPYRLTPGEGKVEIDFAGWDAQVRPVMEGLPELDGAKGSAVLVPSPPGENALNRFKYALSFRQHLKAQGWERGAVELPSSESTPLQPRSTAFGSWEECAQAQGARRWWLLPVEPLALGAPPAGVRALGWLAYGAGAAGVRYTQAFDGFRTASFAQGLDHGALFYPSVALGEGAPLAIPSVRLALLRDGLEDYELLKGVERTAGAAAARGWARKLAPGPEDFAQEPLRYDSAKKALAAAAQGAVPVNAASSR